MRSPTSFIIAATAIGLLSFTEHKDRSAKKSFINDSPNGVITIIVEKSNYTLKVYDAEGWYATYPVVFGEKTLSDKMMEGDRRTPEGTYSIVAKRPHEKWQKFLSINYPTKADYEKFNYRKSKGLIPKTAKIGGGIGIHGTWPRDEMVIDYYQNWTQGCISMRRIDVDEIYSYVPVGTKIIIRQ